MSPSLQPSQNRYGATVPGVKGCRQIRRGRRFEDILWLGKKNRRGGEGLASALHDIESPPKEETAFYLQAPSASRCWFGFPRVWASFFFFI